MSHMNHNPVKYYCYLKMKQQRLGGVSQLRYQETQALVSLDSHWGLWESWKKLLLLSLPLSLIGDNFILKIEYESLLDMEYVPLK